MLIRLITPAPAGSFHGNRVTASRWARLLRDLGHRVRIAQDYRGEPCDLLVALHARRSYEAVSFYKKQRPGAPLIVALTGTDLYGDLRKSRKARMALEWADALVLLQPLGAAALPAHLRGKARAIIQSAVKPIRAIHAPRGEFRVCVLAHLRPVKDPLLAAAACRNLPDASRIRVLHLGRALTRGMEKKARKEMAREPRYRWLGEVPRPRALSILAGSRLLLLTSRLEGGANAVSEALAAGVPVLSSRIPGSIGILGDGYPGFFPAGDARALARLLDRCESDTAFYRRLREHCRGLSPLVRPSRERAAWKRLLGEIRRAAFSFRSHARPEIPKFHSKEAVMEEGEG